MITACPLCATKYDLPDEEGANAKVMRCSTCGHGWIESRLQDVCDLSSIEEEWTKDTSMTTELDAAVAAEARKIARAAQVAEQRARARRNRRMAAARGWAGLATGVGLVLGLVAVFPERIVQAAPAAAKLYELAGKPVNIRGFVISDVEQKVMLVGGQPVLALKGHVTNVAGDDRRVPAIRFILKNANSQPLHAWTLKGLDTRPLPSGSRSNFVTRLAAPPDGVESVEIRFARDDEIG